MQLITFSLLEQSCNWHKKIRSSWYRFATFYQGRPWQSYWPI